MDLELIDRNTLIEDSTDVLDHYFKEGSLEAEEGPCFEEEMTKMRVMMKVVTMKLCHFGKTHLEKRREKMNRFFL